MMSEEAWAQYLTVRNEIAELVVGRERTLRDLPHPEWFTGKTAYDWICAEAFYGSVYSNGLALKKLKEILGPK